MASKLSAGPASFVGVVALQADPLELIGLGAAVLLASVFVWAAIAKLRDRKATAVDFLSLGLPQPKLLAVAVPIVELAVAALLIVWPGWGGVAAFGLLAVFTTLLISVIRSGRVASCACFGGSSSRPVSTQHLLRNGGLLLLAVAAATVDQWTGELLF